MKRNRLLQHEIVRVPRGWEGREHDKALIVQLNRILDDIYNRFDSRKEAGEGLAGKADKSEAVSNITRSGTTFTATKADGTTFTFTQQDNDHYAWSDITNKPDTATRWPAWSEVTSKPNYYDGSAIKNITRSGTTFTATKMDGTTFTFDQQDNNTWRGIQDNLTSDSTTDSLSAKQGKNLANGSARDSTKALKTEAIKSISRSGTTFTATRCDDTTFTFTQQDVGSDRIPYNTAGGIATCSGGGSNWYFRIATITITSSYINRPVVFEISQRGYKFCHIQTTFASVNNTDPGLGSFVTDSDQVYYIKKVATSEWEIYGKYSEQWGEACLHRITGLGANIGVTVDMVNIGTTEPSGVTTAGFYLNAAWAGNGISNITRSGTTFTVTRANGGTFTFTQQDDNTWRGVVNNLTSTSTSDSLTANMGKSLQDKKNTTTILLSARTTSVGSSYTIANITNYRLLTLGVFNGGEWKYWTFPAWNTTVDCSWPAVDSLSWRIACVVQITGNTKLKVTKWAAAGFTQSSCKIELTGSIAT